MYATQLNTIPAHTHEHNTHTPIRTRYQNFTTFATYICLVLTTKMLIIVKSKRVLMPSAWLSRIIPRIERDKHCCQSHTTMYCVWIAKRLRYSHDTRLLCAFICVRIRVCKWVYVFVLFGIKSHSHWYTSFLTLVLWKPYEVKLHFILSASKIVYLLY